MVVVVVVVVAVPVAAVVVGVGFVLVWLQWRLQEVLTHRVRVIAGEGRPNEGDEMPPHV